jgi:hypothetical protein
VCGWLGVVLGTCISHTLCRAYGNSNDELPNDDECNDRICMMTGRPRLRSSQTAVYLVPPPLPLPIRSPLCHFFESSYLLIRLSECNDSKRTYGSPDQPRHEHVLLPRAPMHSDANVFLPRSVYKRTPTGSIVFLRLPRHARPPPTQPVHSPVVMCSFPQDPTPPLCTTAMGASCPTAWRFSSLSHFETLYLVIQVSDFTDSMRTTARQTVLVMNMVSSLG